MRWLALPVLALLLAGCSGDDDERSSPPKGEARLELMRGSNGREKGPYMGVSCPKPNSIACDRVGLAVWVAKPAATITADIAGRELRLRSPRPTRAEGRETYWEGFLQPAGLRDGPLKVKPDRGTEYWRGLHPVSARVRVRATYRGGGAASRTIRVPLAAGWG